MYNSGTTTRQSGRHRPPLKWAGGKYRIVEYIKSRLPAGKRLIEPFTGSAALFLNTDFDDYLLNDINADLVNFYRFLHNRGDSFTRYAEQFFSGHYNNEDAFYDFRETFNTTADKRLKAGLFLYLNRHGYNGLCRYNAAGEFNVPFGRYRHPYFPARELGYFSKKAQGIRFANRDFAAIMKSARPGDIIYCDPPYIPLSQTANFTTYSKNGFSMTEQEQLVNLAKELAARDIPVLVSNHATEASKNLYREATIHTLDVQRNISRLGNNRKPATELLAVF